MDLSQLKVETFEGINDVPAAPTSTEAGNGSHLIALHNGLTDVVQECRSLVDVALSDASEAQSSIQEISGLVASLAPRLHVHWHQDSLVTSGNEIAVLQSPEQDFGISFFQSPAALGDSFEYTVALRPGRYFLKMYGIGRPNSGLLSLQSSSLDGETFFDFQTDQITYNHVITKSLQISGFGLHRFIYTALYKDEQLQDSTDYRCNITRITLLKLPSWLGGGE